MIDQNTVAFVTGTNRGIGRAIVSELLDAGVAKVYAATRQPSASGAQYTDQRVVAVQLDVTNAGQVTAAAARGSDVNLLINNAGVLDFGDIITAPIADIERNMATNFYGKLAMARAFVPVISDNGGGAIVNMLTLVSLVSMPGLAVYSASKAAAWSMALSLRASLAGQNIAVHNVFPGAVDTDMLAGVEMDKTNPRDVAAAIVKGVGAGDEDIFPDPMSASVYESWCSDHKAVEKQFAEM